MIEIETTVYIYIHIIKNLSICVSMKVTNVLYMEHVQSVRKKKVYHMSLKTFVVSGLKPLVRSREPTWDSTIKVEIAEENKIA